MNYNTITNGAHLTSATSAIAPPLFLPRPEIMYIYVLHFFCPAPNIFSKCTTTFKLRWAPMQLCSNTSEFLETDCFLTIVMAEVDVKNREQGLPVIVSTYKQLNKQAFELLGNLINVTHIANSTQTSLRVFLRRFTFIIVWTMVHGVHLSMMWCKCDIRRASYVNG